ncbi:hypothetical protein QFC24_006224 [Naganishia onofrii]|uniref:Uncharacterized protein n=1 Tax=Naganishia onofrii TaxID=1851511 RepID=A0ACC2X4T4_9TREE|nr:hypothetical protein QFC24_006224 [Naganishia onofrii]
MTAVKNPAVARCPYYMTTLSRCNSENPDYANLTLRTDYGIKRKAYEIEQETTNVKKAKLQKDSGINGQSVLSAIDSLSFPWSFRLDMMHVLFENIAPQLIMSWRGNYKNEKDDKGKDQPDNRDFVFSDAAWEEIKAEVASSNTMVPSQFALCEPD